MATTDLTNNGKVQSVSRMMIELQNVMRRIDNDEVDEKKGRLLLRAHAVNTKYVELYLQAARLDTRMRPEFIRNMIGAPEAPEASAPTIEGTEAK
jgi:L-fucose isomerase-like protein